MDDSKSTALHRRSASSKRDAVPLAPSVRSPGPGARCNLVVNKLRSAQTFFLPDGPNIEAGVSGTAHTSSSRQPMKDAFQKDSDDYPVSAAMRPLVGAKPA
jgi:hypothetical protein